MNIQKIKSLELEESMFLTRHISESACALSNKLKLIEAEIAQTPQKTGYNLQQMPQFEADVTKKVADLKYLNGSLSKNLKNIQGAVRAADANILACTQYVGGIFTEICKSMVPSSTRIGDKFSDNASKNARLTMTANTNWHNLLRSGQFHKFKQSLQTLVHMIADFAGIANNFPKVLLSDQQPVNGRLTLTGYLSRCKFDINPKLTSLILEEFGIKDIENNYAVQIEGFAR